MVELALLVMILALLEKSREQKQLPYFILSVINPEEFTNEKSSGFEIFTLDLCSCGYFLLHQYFFFHAKFNNPSK
jgi:hypothetical protein